MTAIALLAWWLALSVVAGFIFGRIASRNNDRVSPGWLQRHAAGRRQL